MTDHARGIVATVVGAVAGGVAGYMLFTDHGRGVRRAIEPALEDLVRELNQFRGTMQKAAGVASEGWRLLNGALGEHEPGWTGARQASPF